MALCFSPVGSKLRVRSRKFPAVVNCTAIDWFHEWPQEALESVSLKFLQEVDNIEVRSLLLSLFLSHFSFPLSLSFSLSLFLSFSHTLFFRSHSLSLSFVIIIHNKTSNTLPLLSSQPELKESVSKFMAYVHVSVNHTSKEYLSNERRYNYTTPKSFLEQIKLYQSLLANKSRDLTMKMERLENGLQKLNSTSAQVRPYLTLF